MDATLKGSTSSGYSILQGCIIYSCFVWAWSGSVAEQSEAITWTLASLFSFSFLLGTSICQRWQEFEARYGVVFWAYNGQVAHKYQDKIMQAVSREIQKKSNNDAFHVSMKSSIFIVGIMCFSNCCRSLNAARWSEICIDSLQCDILVVSKLSGGCTVPEAMCRDTMYLFDMTGLQCLQRISTVTCFLTTLKGCYVNTVVSLYWLASKSLTYVVMCKTRGIDKSWMFVPKWWRFHCCYRLVS